MTDAKRTRIILPRRLLTPPRKQRGAIQIAGASTMVSSEEGPTVSARLDGRVNTVLSGTCYSGYQLQNDGDEYEYNSAGNITNLTTWLDTGAAGDVWQTWNRTGGTLSDWNSLGAGNNGVRLNLGTTRSFRIVRSPTGINTIIGYVQFHDAASGGNLLQTTSTVTWSAENDFDPCPICCFTPDTPIAMARGIEVPIASIRKGDEIIVYDPFKNEQYAQEVTGVIDRVNRTMYRVTFNDGTFLDVSDDHPLHVEGKGGAAIDPLYEYKDIGIPETLAVGDRVSTIHPGTHKTINAIQAINYPGKVYTLENTLFYANGLLVY